MRIANPLPSRRRHRLNRCSEINLPGQTAQQLARAASDFKGHKVEAIRSIDEAIRHLHEALEADKR